MTIAPGRRRGPSLGLALALAVAARADAQPPLDADASRGPVDAVLAGATDVDGISERVGAAPHVCIEATPAVLLCEWRLGNRQRGWAALADTIGTSLRIALLCELPTDRSARAPRSCAVYPQRSNRTSWRVRKPTGRDVYRGEKPGAKRRRYQQLAAQAVDSALTLTELSAIVGAAPDWCTLEGDRRRCLWKATSRTYGHGTLTVAAGVSKGNKVRLDCTLPTDGRDRAPNSCHIEVGA